MFRKRDPQTSLLATSNLLDDETRARLEADWPGEFRRSALPMIDEELFRAFYCPDNGRPNRPVQTLVGLLLLKEMRDLTDEEALGALEFDLRWHVALELTQEEAHVCQKTLHNFRAKLAASDRGQILFEQVAARVIAALGLSTDRQRLDSTHIRSNFAILTRLGLFCETVRHFLRELSGLAPKKSRALPPGLVARYLKSDGTATCYHDARSSDGRRRLGVAARDVWRLVDRFTGDQRVAALGSHALLVRLFDEQCQVVAEPQAPAEDDADRELGPVPVVLKEPTAVGADSLQTPHEPEATYSGRKGKGFEVQAAETVGNGQKPEVITYVDLTDSCVSDEKVPVPALENLAARSMAPKELLTDTNFGSTENVIALAQKGTELVAPVPGPEMSSEPCGEAPESQTVSRGRAARVGEPKGAQETRRSAESARGRDLSKADFVVDPKGSEPARCPAGRSAGGERRDAGSGKVRLVFTAEACAGCPCARRCPAKRRGDGTRVLRTTLHASVLARRRAYQRTPDFRKRYAERAGIEATCSELKGPHGLGRLRVRGKARVRLAVLLKATACNVKRMIKYLVEMAGAGAGGNGGPGAGGTSGPATAAAARTGGHFLGRILNAIRSVTISGLTCQRPPIAASAA